MSVEIWRRTGPGLGCELTGQRALIPIPFDSIATGARDARELPLLDPRWSFSGASLRLTRCRRKGLASSECHRRPAHLRTAQHIGPCRWATATPRRGDLDITQCGA